MHLDSSLLSVRFSDVCYVYIHMYILFCCCCCCCCCYCRCCYILYSLASFFRSQYHFPSCFPWCVFFNYCSRKGCFHFDAYLLSLFLSSGIEQYIHRFGADPFRSLSLLLSCFLTESWCVCVYCLLRRSFFGSLKFSLSSSPS